MMRQFVVERPPTYTREIILISPIVAIRIGLIQRSPITYITLAIGSCGNIACAKGLGFGLSWLSLEYIKFLPGFIRLYYNNGH